MAHSRKILSAVLELSAPSICFNNSVFTLRVCSSSRELRWRQMLSISSINMTDRPGWLVACWNSSLISLREKITWATPWENLSSEMCDYRNDPKFSDRYAWANSVDPDQTARSSLILVYTVCHSVCIIWTHYSMVEPHSSNFRVITTNFLGVRIFRKFTVSKTQTGLPSNNSKLGSWKFGYSNYKYYTIKAVNNNLCICAAWSA